tara:strand:- start:85 stop:420 length:336 start_codon:yes stop_codon:yes gene_type:complete
MCGINDFNFQDKEPSNKMINIIGSRSLDFTGYTSFADYSASYNRLGIVDILVRANQPYLFEKLIISFNGEIYNYLGFKKLLEQEGYNFKTSSDIEVIINFLKNMVLIHSKL